MVRVIMLCAVVAIAAVLPGCGVGSEVKKDPLFQPAEDVYSAAIAGDVEAVEMYMNQGGYDHMVANYDGLLPLCAAAKGGNVEIIFMMVDEGAIVDMTDLNQKTPLQYAKEAGHDEAVQVLLELGAKE